MKTVAVVELLSASAVLSASLFAVGCSSSAPDVPTHPPQPAQTATSSAKFAYVVDNGDNAVSMYTVSSTGQWTPTSPATVATGAQPAVIVVDPQGKFAYVSNTRDNTISEYAIDQNTGVLTPLSPATVPSGALPQDLALHPSGNFAYSVNWADGTLTVFSVNRSSGQLTAIQTAAVPGYSVPVPEAVTVNPAGTFLYVSAGYLETYSIDQNTGRLTLLPEHYVNDGLRPFKLAFDPSGQFAYLPDNSSSNVYEYSIGSDGIPAQLSSSPVSAGTQPAWVTVDPMGQFAYVSDRLGGTLTSFNVSDATGSLTPVPGNEIASEIYGPWQSQVDPSGQILYVMNEGTSQLAGSVSSFAISSSGALTYIGNAPAGHTLWSFAIVPAQ